MNPLRARCQTCGCLLAQDNPRVRCGPCDRAARYGTAQQIALPATVSLRTLVAAWELGFPAFRDAAQLDDAQAAALAAHLRLLPPRTQLTAEHLVALARSRNTPSTVLARRLGLSRWTVAAWRRSLGLERLTRATRPSGQAPAADGEVPRVDVVVDDRVRLLVSGVPIRLGRSARALIEELAAAHPAAVHDTRLCRSLFATPTPNTARGALQAAVSRLRRHLPPGAIARAHGGYRLDLPASAIHRSPERHGA